MSRFGPSGRSISAALCVAVLLAACTAPSGPRTSSSDAGSASARSETGFPSPSEPDATAAPAASAEPEWKTFTTSDGRLMFDYPSYWTIKDRDREAAPGGSFVEIMSGAGKSIATLRTNLAIGPPQCTEKYSYSLMDSEDLPALAQGGVNPYFVFERRATPGMDPSKPAAMAYGITSTPLPSGRSACPIHQFFTWPSGVATFGGAYDPLDTTPSNTPNVNVHEAYTGTDEYDAIRATIMSLRPAEK